VRRVQRHGARFGQQRHRVRFGGPGDVFEAPVVELHVLVVDGGSLVVDGGSLLVESEA